MENSIPLILDISSDEEAGFGDSREVSRSGVGIGEDYDWLSKLLSEVGGTIDDDSDDVVLVSEVFPEAPKKSRSESFEPSDKVVHVNSDGDDDDCVVLDGDPDKAVVIVNSRVEDDDLDDLEIIGEKGEIACRDFPHPRHLCAKFHFASTPHEIHCGQCHCYVCDSLAPCSRWGTGVCSVDHCHASEKDEYWKAERKRAKRGDKPTPEVATSGTCRIESFFATAHAPEISQQLLNSSVQNRGTIPATFPPHPMSPNVIFPDAVNHISGHPSGVAVPRYRPQSRLATLRSHPTSNNSTPSRQGTGSRNCQSFHPRAVFKRHGSVGTSPNNKHAYGSQSLKSCSLRTPVVQERHGRKQQSFWSHSPDSARPQPRSSSPLSMNVRHANYLPSQSRIHSQPYSHSLHQDPIQYQSQTPAQPYANRNFSSAAPLRPNISSQPSLGSIDNLVLPQPPHLFQTDNAAPYEAVASYQSDAGNAFGSQLHMRSLISSQPNVSHNLDNASSQLQPQHDPTSLLMNGQNDVQQGNQTQNGLHVSPTDFNYFPDSSLNNGHLQINVEESQYESIAPAETSQPQNEPKNNHHPSTVPEDNFPRQSVVLSDYASPIKDGSCQVTESIGPDPLDFQVDGWMFENQSFSGVVENCSPPNWGILPLEPAFIDTGSLFDTLNFRE